MPGINVCPKCGKRWRSERHSCLPSAIDKKKRIDKMLAPRSDKK